MCSAVRNLAPFRSTSVLCAGTYQFACKTCEREVKDLDEKEKCSRALARGLAETPDRLRDRIELITEAETHRPTCLRCGSNMKFGEAVQLDSSPLRDGILARIFEVQPAYCIGCGKIEFYDPTILRKDRFMAYLINRDVVL